MYNSNSIALAGICEIMLIKQSDVISLKIDATNYKCVLIKHNMLNCRNNQQNMQIVKTGNDKKVEDDNETNACSLCKINLQGFYKILFFE